MHTFLLRKHQKQFKCPSVGLYFSTFQPLVQDKYLSFHPCSLYFLTSHLYFNLLWCSFFRTRNYIKISLVKVNNDLNYVKMCEDFPVGQMTNLRNIQQSPLLPSSPCNLTLSQPFFNHYSFFCGFYNMVCFSSISFACSSVWL